MPSKEPFSFNKKALKFYQRPFDQSYLNIELITINLLSHPSFYRDQLQRLKAHRASQHLSLHPRGAE